MATPLEKYPVTMALPQRIVSFYGDNVVAVQQSDGIIFVVFGHLCANLGLEQQAQARRIRRHIVLNEGLITITVQTDGGPQQVQALKLSLLPLWLSGVQTDRIKSELKEQLVRYQREAADVLWQAFREQIVREDTGDELTTSTDAEFAQLQQIVEMGRAITRMAEDQIEQRRRVDAAARLVKGIRVELTDVQVRLGVLEDKVNPATYISDTQASEVSTKVKALAEMLTKGDQSKNHYQGIYLELYRRFGVSGYKLLRREQFESVIAFLDEWRVVGEGEA